jgi:hypothetical protein
LTSNSKIFNSKTDFNQWIEWDFKTSQIEPTHYSIRTHNSETGGNHLQNWVIEGRNEKEEWIKLDEQRNDSQLNGKGRIAAFEIANRFRVRILRLRQIGQNHRGDHMLAFNSFELFGELFRNTNRDPQSLRFHSIESDLCQLQTTLIEKSILPKRFALEEDRFDGIIAYLTRNCGGNVSDCGIVEIKASSFVDDTYLPKNAANFAWDSPIFYSKNEMNQWIEWDFKTSQIEPTHYSISTHGSPTAVLICNIG